MQSADTLNLQAFLAALDQLEAPLDASIEAEVSAAIQQLTQIADRYPPLQMQFDAALSELLNDYQTQPRQKFIGSLSSVTQINASSNPTQQQRLASVYDQAVTVFENEQIATRWLQRPNQALGGAIPLKLAETETGLEQVSAVLNRIEYGGYS